MISSVGLEVMNSTNSDLSWKTVTKGRRSRKSIARSLNGVANSTSPKRVGDFSGSDSDKFGDVVHGQSSTSGKSENVPIKKRRHLLQSPLPHPWTPSLHRQASSPSSAAIRSGEGFDNAFLCDRTEYRYNDAGDFSGIELLAAAASMDDYDDNNNKQDLVVDGSLIPKDSDASSSIIVSKLDSKSSKSDNSSNNMTVDGGNVNCSPVLNNSAAASQSLSGSSKDVTVPKVSRQYWDLNTPMDAWVEPYDDSIAEKALNDANDDLHMEEKQDSRDHVLIKPSGRIEESPEFTMEENKSPTVSPDAICVERPSLEEHLLEPPKRSYTDAIETINEAGVKDADERNSNQVSNTEADMKAALNQVFTTDAILENSPRTNLFCYSGTPPSEEKIKTMCGPVAVVHEDCSSNVRGSERIASDRILTRTQAVTEHDFLSSDISESAINAQRKDLKDFQKTSGPHGASNGNCQPVLSADSNMQNDGISVSGSTVAAFQGHLGLSELVAKHEDSNLPNDGSNRTMVEDSCKSCSAGALCDEPTSSVGRISSAIDGGQHDSDVSNENHTQMVVGDDVTRFPEGYDSPYEDGELRGSFLYSWEDNGLEAECVDYESDGRNEDSSDAAGYPGSEIVEGGSEGSHGIGGRSLLVKRSSEVKSKGSVKDSLKGHFVKDESDNNKIVGKGSNAGSGTTVEQSMEMVIEENYDGVKRRQLAHRRSTIDLKVTHIGEYASKTARGKLQSRIEGLSSTEPAEGKDFFIRQYRPHHFGGSYSRPERDTSPDKYLGRYRPATHGERDGVRQWTTWGSKRRYTTNYQGADGLNHARPRSKTGDSTDKIGGLDFHDSRPTANNYMPKGLHRPLVRRSPMDRDDYFGVGRRMPLTRGVSNYRSRGHYSQRPSRDFGDDFEPLPDDACMPGYLSRRERSFSPSPARSGHMALNRRRSRSRSRTRSPRAWHSNRGRRVLGTTRRQSRSPDFRSEARMERMRVPYPKPVFAPDYGEGYLSPSRGRFSPQRNCRRWDDDGTFPDNNHIRRRRSPMREFRRTQRFDAVGPSGRLKRDEYFGPMNRPGKFSFVANGGGRGCKSESNCDGRRRDDSGEMMHRGLHSDEVANGRRFRNNAAAAAAADDDFETSNQNNEDDVRVTDAKDVPKTQGGDKQDKGAIKI